MPEIVVAAQGRTGTGKNANRRLRAEGLIPGVLYGSSKKDPVAVAVSPKEIGAILRSAAGENTLFDLDMDGGRRKVILKEWQVEPIKGKLLHADFYEVALDKLIEVEVHIDLQGTPVGVKVQGGILDFVTRNLEVECLPTDIPEKISVDISHLEMGKHVRVSDLEVPKNVRVLTDADVVVVHVVAARAEEVAVTPDAAAAAVPGAEPEVVKAKGKGEEGEEKAADAGKEKDKDKKEKKEKDKK